MFTSYSQTQLSESVSHLRHNVVAYSTEICRRRAEMYEKATHVFHRLGSCPKIHVDMRYCRYLLQKRVQKEDWLSHHLMLFLADRDDGDDGAVLAQEPDLARPPRRQRSQVSAIAATAKSQIHKCLKCLPFKYQNWYVILFLELTPNLQWRRWMGWGCRCWRWRPCRTPPSSGCCCSPCLLLNRRRRWSHSSNQEFRWHFNISCFLHALVKFHLPFCYCIIKGPNISSTQLLTCIKVTPWMIVLWIDFWTNLSDINQSTCIFIRN